MTPTAAKGLAEELRQALERLAGVCGASATACVRAIGANLWDPEWSAWNHAMSAAHYARVLRRDVRLTVLDCEQLRQSLETEGYQGPLRDRLEALSRTVNRIPVLDRDDLPHLRDSVIIMRGPRWAETRGVGPVRHGATQDPRVIREAGELRAAIAQRLRQVNGQRRCRLVGPDQVLQVLHDTATQGHGYMDGGSVGPSYGYQTSTTAVGGRLGTSGAVLLVFREVDADAPERAFWFGSRPDLVIPRAIVQALDHRDHLGPTPDMAALAAPKTAQRIER